MIDLVIYAGIGGLAVLAYIAAVQVLGSVLQHFISDETDPKYRKHDRFAFGNIALIVLIVCTTIGWLIHTTITGGFG